MPCIPRDKTTSGSQLHDISPDVKVSRLPLGDSRSYKVATYDPLSNSLVLCCKTAIYSRSLDPGAADAPQLLAGSEIEGGVQDGRGERARFGRIRDCIVDGYGSAWVYDQPEGGLGRIRRVRPDGTVSSVVSDLPEFDTQYDCLAVLPNGYLAAAAADGHGLLVLDLGLKPNACHPAAAPPPEHTLPHDMAALLDRQPDGSADVEVEVGGQVFQAHTAVLAARSEYFRQRLGPGAGFADGGSQRLSLPDADPAAFALVLRYMYTDRVPVGPIPAALLQPVGELADRLLLPGLCEQVGSQLLAAVCAASVVGLLLWAEQRGTWFGSLLAGLKAWFVEHRQEVGTKHPAAVSSCSLATRTWRGSCTTGLVSSRRYRSHRHSHTTSAGTARGGVRDAVGCDARRSM